MLISRRDPLKEVPIRGSVASVSSSQIRIAFRDQFDEEDLWRCVRRDARVLVEISLMLTATD